MPYLAVSVFPWLTALNTLLQALHTCLDPTLKDVLQRDFGAAPLDNLITHLQSQFEVKLPNCCSLITKASAQVHCRSGCRTVHLSFVNICPSVYSVFRYNCHGNRKSVSSLVLICLVLDVIVLYLVKIINMIINHSEYSCPVSLYPITWSFQAAMYTVPTFQVLINCCFCKMYSFSLIMSTPHYNCQY